MMDRRAFVQALAGVALLSPMAAAETPLKARRIGLLMSTTPLAASHIVAAFLVRNWSGVFKEWSTKAVRDAFFASPQFPRLLNPTRSRTPSRAVSKMGCSAM